MPQMFPMNWVMIFMFIIFMFYLSSVKLFFWSLPEPSTESHKSSFTLDSNKWMW